MKKLGLKKIYNNNEFKIYNIMKDLSKYTYNLNKYIYFKLYFW